MKEREGEQVNGGEKKNEKVGGHKNGRDRGGGGGACVLSNNRDTGHDSFCIYVTV